MESNGWFQSPDRLLYKEKRPEQPKISRTQEVNAESKPLKEVVFQIAQKEADKWDFLLETSSYWKTLWGTSVKGKKLKRKKGHLQTEIENVRNYRVKRVQKAPEKLESPGWRFVRVKNDVLKCEGRVSGFQPTYLIEG